jgi:DNA polymerase III epsilon subunit family exonuclease
MNNYVALDFETTGLCPMRAEVVEIAAVKMQDGRLLDSFHTLLKPSVPVEEGALKQHGLSDAFLASNGNDPQDKWSEFFRFLGNSPLIAHNGLSFDFPFLYNAFSRHKIAHGENPLIDTLILPRQFLKTNTGRFNLHDLCTAAGIKNERAHRAMPDVEALAKLVEVIFGYGISVDGMHKLCGEYSFRELGDVPKGFELASKAIEEGLDLCIDYWGFSKPRRQRWVKPIGIILRRGHQYILAICLEKNEERQFRLDRVQKLVAVR